MSSILGIDAAWTEREPSGVALVRGEGEAWDVVCVAPSYGTFIASGDGNPVDWSPSGPFVGSLPDLRALLRAARALASDPLCIVAIWPHTTVAERVSRLLEQLDRINAALGAVMGGAPLQLPAAARTRSLAELKRYEDALDALISAWVGARYSTGQAAAYGDGTAAIWIPRSDT